MGILSRTLDNFRANSCIRSWLIILLQCLVFLFIGLYQARADFCGREANQFNRQVVGAGHSVANTGNLFKSCKQPLIGHHLVSFAGKMNRRRVELINLVASLNSGDYKGRCENLGKVKQKSPGIRRMIDDAIGNFTSNKNRFLGAIDKMSESPNRECQDIRGVTEQVRVLEASYMPSVSQAFESLNNCINSLGARPQFQCN